MKEDNDAGRNGLFFLFLFLCRSFGRFVNKVKARSTRSSEALSKTQGGFKDRDSGHVRVRQVKSSRGDIRVTRFE